MINTKVLADDERPARRDGTCYYCNRPIGFEHRGDCVILSGRLFEAIPPYAWQPIETLQEGFHVALFFPQGEKGVGGIEMATVYFNDGDWSFWTHGGPNAGWDFEPAKGERPTMWMRLLKPGDAA